jgi:uncharacterized membrane protein
VWAHEAGSPGVSKIDVLQIIPGVAAIPQLAYVGGVALVFPRTPRIAAIALGALLCMCSLVTQLLRNLYDPANVSFRTTVFEPLAIARLGWLLLGPNTIPAPVERAIRGLLATCLIVFGVDHFIALNSIATRLIANWIPWQVFWTSFFGIAFIAGGLSIGLQVLKRWGAACLGLMFALWIVASLASGAEIVQFPELATPQPMFEPVHCNPTVGRLMGSGFAREEPFAK